jgi:hypothetical protein
VLHLALAIVFVVIWLLMPKREGITGRGFDPKALLYLLQGVVFPVARGLALLDPHVSLAALATVLGLSWLILACRPWSPKECTGGLLASLLILLGIAPVWAGLSWAYVKIGSRLLYPATLGVGALWARWMIPNDDATPPAKGLAYAIALVVLFVSLSQWARFTRLYEAGHTHLAEAVETMAEDPSQTLVFVNFPDRIEIRPRLYPLGYWGLTLAPGTQPFSDYAQAAYGHSAETRCYASYANGITARERWPYGVDMRGPGLHAEDLFVEAMGADAIYVSKFLSQGTLALEWVGSIVPDNGQPALARYGESVELLHAQLAPTSSQGELGIDLTWRVLAPPKNDDTVFLHVLHPSGEYMQGKDGDPVGALLPMGSWRRGWLVTDRREIPLQELESGKYLVTIGVYNRVTGERYAVQRNDGQPLRFGELLVRTVSVP